MRSESTSSLVCITIASAGLALLMLVGCQSSGVEHRAVIETNVPNVWEDNPVQSVAIKLEITR
jgi:hypothetical protein